jgi:hypothetical protein
MVPYLPVALYRGTASVSNKRFQWYKEYYKASGSCTYIQVPGGALFIGPRSFNDSGDVVSVNFEFHPFCHLVNSYGWIKFQAMARHGGLTPSESTHIYTLRVVKPDVIWTAWYSIIRDTSCYTVLNNGSDGYLSNTNSNALAASAAACCGVFLYWLSMIDSYDTLHNSGHDDDYRLYGPFWHGNPDVSHISTIYQYDNEGGAGWCLEVLGCLACLDSDPAGAQEYIRGYVTGGAVPGDHNRIDWKNFIEMANAITSTSDATPITSIGYEENGYAYQVSSISVTRSLPLLGPICSSLYEINDYDNPESKVWSWNIGQPLLLPDKPIYSFYPPSINSSTYWLWAALGIAVTTAVTVGAVVGAVKFNKWRKQKQLEHIANAEEKRQTATSAMRGVKQEWNEETHRYEDVPFDVSSEEGQQYVNSCMKDYKKTVLTNNISANLIGGTRYDYTSYYGDASETNDDASSSAKERLGNVLYGGSNEDASQLDESNAQVDLSPIINLIRGVN